LGPATVARIARMSHLASDFVTVYDVTIPFTRLTTRYSYVLLSHHCLPLALWESGAVYLWACVFSDLSLSPLRRHLMRPMSRCDVVYRKHRIQVLDFSRLLRLGRWGPLSQGWSMVLVRLHSSVLLRDAKSVSVYVSCMHEESYILLCYVILSLDMVHQLYSYVCLWSVKSILLKVDLFLPLWYLLHI
jgi:hypothetical protein